MYTPNNMNIRFDPSDEGETTIAPASQDVKPVQGPKSAKDFKKVFSKTGREGKDDEDEGAKKSPNDVFAEEIAENAPATSILIQDDEEMPASIFDLPKAERKEKKDPSINLNAGVKSQETHTAKVESPSDLFTRMSSSKVSKTDEISQREEEPAAKLTTRYTPEQADLTYVNPLSVQSTQQLQPSNLPITPTEKTSQGAKVALVQLINELIKTLHTVEKNGQTDTVVTLQHPTLFKDAKLVVSSFDSAKGQLNIAFENLTQEAVKILQMDENRKTLIESLEKKGYNVQNLFATTTSSETVVLIDEASKQQFQRDAESQQDKKRQQEQAEEETP